MIQLKEAKDCCGCNACVQRCPANCIAMREDTEGFSYPEVDINVCIKCEQCLQVCPVVHQGSERKTLSTYAAKNKNEAIRKQSSSGGVFSLLAEHTLSQGGIVFGARFDGNWNLVHDHTETKEGLIAFRGAKYLQSDIKNTFVEAEQHLQSGRKVLFSGTPCQIAGLKLFLHKAYENLFTVDFVCHGVPSPKVWQLYVNELLQSKKFREKAEIVATRNSSVSEITNIEFRNKTFGWKKYNFRIDIRQAEGIKTYCEPFGENVFMRGFLNDLYLRPSCYACPSKNFKSGSDITIGDYWGVGNILPEYDDDKGISLVMINTGKAMGIYAGLDLHSVETPYEKALGNNPVIEKSVTMNPKRSLFFDTMKTTDVSLLINQLLSVSFSSRLKRKAITLLHILKNKFSLI